MLFNPAADSALPTLVRDEELVAANSEIWTAATLLQIRALPQRTGADAARREPILAQWRTVAGNRLFVPFSVAMIGSYVLSFQVYLALPLQARVVASSEFTATALVAAIFAVSGIVTILAQLRITAWCRRRWARRGR